MRQAHRKVWRCAGSRLQGPTGVHTDIGDLRFPEEFQLPTTFVIRSGIDDAIVQRRFGFALHESADPLPSRVSDDEPDIKNDVKPHKKPPTCPWRTITDNCRTPAAPLLSFRGWKRRKLELSSQRSARRFNPAPRHDQAPSASLLSPRSIAVDGACATCGRRPLPRCQENRQVPSSL